MAILARYFVAIFARSEHVASRSLRNKDLPIQINHYTLKSKEEYMEKDLKGDVFFEKPTHDERAFYLREYRCSAPDYTAYKYLTALKERLFCQKQKKSCL